MTYRTNKEFKQQYHRPWQLPFVAGYLELALRERMLRWMAGTLTEARGHKDRGKHWARCARHNASMGLPRDGDQDFTRKRIELLVQKELCKRYAWVDKALRGSVKEPPHNASQRAVDCYDCNIRVKVENGILTATDLSRGVTKNWHWEHVFPRTWPLSGEEAKAIVSYFHRIRFPLPVQEPPMKSAEIIP